MNMTKLTAILVIVSFIGFFLCTQLSSSTISKEERKILKNNKKLIKAVEKGKTKKIQKIILKPTTFGARNKALLITVEQGNLGIVKLLISSGERIDVNIQNEEGRTPLEIVFTKKYTEIFYYLIESGANAKWYVDSLKIKRVVEELDKINSLNPHLISKGEIQNIRDDIMFDRYKNKKDVSKLLEFLRNYPNNRHFETLLDKVYNIALNKKYLSEMRSLANSFSKHHLYDELKKQIAWKEKAYEYFQDDQEYEEIKDDIDLLEFWTYGNRYGLENKYRRKYEEAKQRLILLKEEKEKNELNSEETEILFLPLNIISEMLDDYKLTYEKLKSLAFNTKMANKIAITIINYINKIDTVGIESQYVAKYLGEFPKPSGWGLNFEDIFGTAKYAKKTMSGRLCYEELILTNFLIFSQNFVGQIIPKLDKNEMKGFVNFKKGTVFEKHAALVALKLILKSDCISKRDLIRMIERNMFEIVTNKKESYIIRYQAMGVLANFCKEVPKEFLTNYSDVLDAAERYKGIKKEMIKEISKARDLRELSILIDTVALVKGYFDSIKSSNTQYSAYSSSKNSGSLEYGSLNIKIDSEWFFGILIDIKMTIKGQNIYYSNTKKDHCEHTTCDLLNFYAPYDTYDITVTCTERSGEKYNTRSFELKNIEHKCKTTWVSTFGNTVSVNCY